jgi:hypothetical protein
MSYVLIALVVGVLLLPLQMIADRLVWRKIRAGLGGRLKVMVSGGSLLSPQLEGFFRLTGLNVSRIDVISIYLSICLCSVCTDSYSHSPPNSHPHSPPSTISHLPSPTPPPPPPPPPHPPTPTYPPLTHTHIHTVAGWLRAHGDLTCSVCTAVRETKHRIYR